MKGVTKRALGIATVLAAGLACQEVRAPGTHRVEVQVLDEQGAPLERFNLQCFRHPDGEQRWLTGVRPVLGVVTGVVTIDGIEEGLNVLKVHPIERAQHPLGGWLCFTVTAQGAARQVLRLPASTRRLLQVVRGNGTPIGKSLVEVVQVFGDSPADRHSPPKLVEFVPKREGAGHEALQVFAASTSADGELELIAPRGGTFDLWLSGEQHLPKRLESVPLDYSEPLRIQVREGARLRGTVGPAKALQVLKQGRTGMALEVRWLRLTLEDPEDPTRVHPRSQISPGVGIEPDGRFLLTAIPPGTWDLVLHYAFANPGTHLAPSPQREVLARVSVKDGETRELDLDIGAITSSGLEVQFLRAGVPWSGALVTLADELAEDRGDAPPATVACDQDGRLALRLPAATYGLWVHASPGSMPIPHEVRVERGRVTERRFDVRDLRIEVRLVDENGRPVPDRDVILSLPTFECAARSDAKGWITLRPAPPKPFRVGIWPAHMRDAKARLAIQRGPGRDLPENQLIELGLVTPPVDRDVLAVELRVPR